MCKPGLGINRKFWFEHLFFLKDTCEQATGFLLQVGLACFQTKVLCKSVDAPGLKKKESHQARKFWRFRFQAGCRPGQSSLLPFHDKLHTFQVPTCFLERKKCGRVQAAKGKLNHFNHAFLFPKDRPVVVVFFAVNTRKSWSSLL